MQVRESIIEELKDGVRWKSQVIDNVMEREKVTVQAVYKELRKLVADEVVIDKLKKLSLTLTYIEHENKKWRRIKGHYTHEVSLDDLLQLAKGKSHTFTFSNIVDLDLFWTQSFVMLERILPSDIPRYSIIPHDWFTYARPSTDAVWTGNKDALRRMVITHSTPVDYEIARQRRDEGYEFTGDENPLKLSEREYITLVSDWVFEVEFDKTVAKELNEYIWSLKKVSEVNPVKMDELMKMKGTFKLKLSNNPKKAKEMAGKVKKYFE